MNSQSSGRGHAQHCAPLQIIDYDIIKDEDESKEDNQGLKTEKSQDSNEMATSKLEAVPESFDEPVHQIKRIKDLAEIGTPNDEDQPAPSEGSLYDELELDLLEQFDSEATTQELSYLYTSCFEWVLSRPVKGLSSQLIIDDYDKIH